MNIQIFGTKKSFDSKKAERFFKERGIKYQFVDMKEKGLSKGEFNSVCQAVGGYEKLIDQECKDKDLLALITYLAEEDKAEKILENQKVLTTKALYAQRKGKPMPERPYHWAGQSVAGILERMEYTGCTCNFKIYSKSYKLKQRIPNSPEDMFILPDTQDAIVSQAQWDRVQERLKLEIEVTEEWLETQETMSADVDAFVALTQKYVDVQKLTPTIVNEYIKKIEVFPPDKSSGKRVQKVKIYFNFVDDVEIPVISEPVVAKSTPGRRKTA